MSVSDELSDFERIGEACQLPNGAYRPRFNFGLLIESIQCAMERVEPLIEGATEEYLSLAS